MMALCSAQVSFVIFRYLYCARKKILHATLDFLNFCLKKQHLNSFRYAVSKDYYISFCAIVQLTHLYMIFHQAQETNVHLVA